MSCSSLSGMAAAAILSPSYWGDMLCENSLHPLWDTNRLGPEQILLCNSACFSVVVCWDTRTGVRERFFYDLFTTQACEPNLLQMVNNLWRRSVAAEPRLLQRREWNMRHKISLILLAGVTGLVALNAYAQGQGQARPSTADPYANNADPGKTQFPLAAPAGQDSHAITIAPPGAVNQGTLDPAKWKYGPTYDPPADAKIWNPVMIKMMKGEK